MHYLQFFFEDTLTIDTESALSKFDQVAEKSKNIGFVRYSVDLEASKPSVCYLLDAKDIAEAEGQLRFLLNSEGIGFSQVKIKKIKKHRLDKHHHTISDHTHTHTHSHSHENNWLKAIIGLTWGAGMIILAMSGLALPLMGIYILTGLTSLVTLYLGYNVYKSAWKGLLENRWDTTTLYSISTITVPVVSIVSTFVPGLPLMVEAAPFVLGFWHLGEYIEHTLLDKLNQNLDVRDCLPKKVILSGKSMNEISVKQLIPNDVIGLEKGSSIPVDGILLDPALIYTTRIDGSPALKMFQSGDLVRAGMSLNEGGSAVTMKVTKPYAESYLSLIAKNIKKTYAEKAPIEVITSKILKFFVPTLIMVAVLSSALIGAFFTPALALQCAISVLVSACPCALSLITPMAVRIGMKKAVEKGAVFKNGKSLQAAADIDTVMFDLNGTLTKGELEVRSIIIEDKQYLKHIAKLESYSSHPIAKTIRRYINDKGSQGIDDLTVNSPIDSSHHAGISGLINGEMFSIGNKKMLESLGVYTIPAPYDDPENGSIYVTKQHKVIAQIAIDDTLRKDAVLTIQQLKKLGKSVYICTGADYSTAIRYASMLDIPQENVFSDTVGVPAYDGDISKTGIVKRLQAQGYKVAMVGDAVNDLSAIASSDLGIAVKSDIGDSITQQHAGMVIQKGGLLPIVSGFKVAKQARNNIFLNLSISLGYNSIITLVAAGVFVSLGLTLPPALGVAMMILESSIILTNLYRFKLQAVSMDQNNLDYEQIDDLSKKEIGDSTVGLLKRFRNNALMDVEPSMPEQRSQDQNRAENNQENSIGREHFDADTFIPANFVPF